MELMDTGSENSESSGWDLEEFTKYMKHDTSVMDASFEDSESSDSDQDPLSTRSSMFDPKYCGPSNLYCPSGVVDKQAVGDKRHIYREALQPQDLPDGLLSVSLLRHQKIALAWMIKKEYSVACCGGILADDQGLGKKISMIALILNQRVLSKPKSKSDCSHNTKAAEDSNPTQQFSNRKPAAGSLVVCPAGVLRKWARELDEKVAEEAKLEVLIYHGDNRTKDPAELARYDVVLTTYAVVGKEVPSKASDEEDERNGNNKRKGISEKKTEGKNGIDCSGTLAKVNWLRVILDEAQTIKNSRTQMSKSCCGLRAKKRWCLTATPIENNFDELFSYFRFLKCDPYASYSTFCNNLKMSIPRYGYRKVRVVLKAIMLRRTKDTLIDGEPIANLLPKSAKVTSVDFSPEERAFYRKLEAESRSQFMTYADAGTVSENYENILLILLRLRQACDHPLLIKGFTSESVSRSSRMAKNLPKYIQANLLDLLETTKICCLCSDIPEDPVVTLCGHIFCHQCVYDNLKGDIIICPSSKCKSPIGPDVVFNKATLRNSISDDNGASSSRSDEEAIVFQPDYVSSKIKAAIEIIRSKSTGVEGPPIKAIVFSQWTKMLDLFEMALDKNHFQYTRLDGSMSLSSRDHVVNQFNTDPEVTVMLMSLKANSLGLNKAAASHVILLDRWWDPAAEDHAIDRIGQTRPVTVSRLTVKDTVEHRIYKLQDEKRKALDLDFGEYQSGTLNVRLNAEDLKYLFMGAHKKRNMVDLIMDDC